MRKAILKTIIYCITFLMYANVQAQNISCTPEDKLLYKEKITSLKALRAVSFGDSLTWIGKSFLDTPYKEKTLEIGAEETLVVNLRGLDCTTFVENVLAFGQVIRKKDTSLNAFTNQLETIRYRNGKLEGYPSRLHYFTEWIADNAKKGLVEDITAALNGIVLEKSIDFMGTHRSSYPFLKDDANFAGILAMETALAEETRCYLPKEEVENQEDQLRSGDIIALATSIEGLDVTHTGFAIRQNNGRIHLLHASTSGAVVISKEPLAVYLKNIKHNIGIIVARPL